MSRASENVEAYLSAYARGDIAGVASAVADDFAFTGPVEKIEGREAFTAAIEHIAPVVRGHRVLRQWVDGDDVCTIYELDVELAEGPDSLTVCEWNTVSGGRVASSLMVFDTGRLQAHGDHPSRHAAGAA